MATGGLHTERTVSVSFASEGSGFYTINATAATADERVTRRDSFLRAGSIKFTPRRNFAGDLIGMDGIKVEAISTEAADVCGYELAPKCVDGDADSSMNYESDFAYAGVFFYCQPMSILSTE